MLAQRGAGHVAEFSQSVMLPTVGGRDQNAPWKVHNCCNCGLNHSGYSVIKATRHQPISWMRKLRFIKGVVSEEIQYLFTTS